MHWSRIFPKVVFEFLSVCNFTNKSLKDTCKFETVNVFTEKKFVKSHADKNSNAISENIPPQGVRFTESITHPII